MEIDFYTRALDSFSGKLKLYYNDAISNIKGETTMKAKGSDGKDIKVGDIALYKEGTKDESAIQVNYASEAIVGGTYLKRTEKSWSVSDDPREFTRLPLNQEEKKKILNSAYLDDLTPK